MTDTKPSPELTGVYPSYAQSPNLTLVRIEGHIGPRTNLRAVDGSTGTLLFEFKALWDEERAIHLKPDKYAVTDKDGKHLLHVTQSALAVSMLEGHWNITEPPLGENNKEGKLVCKLNHHVGVNIFKQRRDLHAIFHNTASDSQEEMTFTLQAVNEAGRWDFKDPEGKVFLEIIEPLTRNNANATVPIPPYADVLLFTTLALVARQEDIAAIKDARTGVMNLYAGADSIA